MASYHLNVKTISRSQGRSATGAAAYRAAERIRCDRYGIEHDYTRKRGVVDAKMFAPGDVDVSAWVEDREHLWNLVEARETRKNSVVAREWTVALPDELSPNARRDLAHSFACTLVDRYGVIADVAIHEPHQEGDERNHHAHILTTTRSVTGEGFGEKTRELDVKKTSSVEVTAMRRTWAELQNAALERAEVESRVDHRSLEVQREEAERAAREAEERGREEQEALRLRLMAEALHRQPEPKLGPRTNAVERKAKKDAERDGTEYVPVTERGAEVAERRAERSLFEEVRERFDTARDTYAAERDRGQGRREAATEALRALLDRERERDARKGAEQAAERQTQEQVDAWTREQERLARERVEAARRAEEQRAEERAAHIAREEAARVVRERAMDPRSDAQIAYDREQIAAIRAQAERQREENREDRKHGRGRSM